MLWLPYIASCTSSYHCSSIKSASMKRISTCIAWSYAARVVHNETIFSSHMNLPFHLNVLFEFCPRLFRCFGYKRRVRLHTLLQISNMSVCRDGACFSLCVLPERSPLLPGNLSVLSQMRFVANISFGMITEFIYVQNMRPQA